ncbi:MAG: alkaline phosphatase family protein [Bacteroidetes bacterium]|nr:alkaline phosphatase family protein [Bacteroidota bacterium]
MFMKKIFLFLIVLFSVIATNAQHGADKRYVLMVSFDGFRYDYVERYNAPNFKKFIANGIAADAMISTFPSKTFANHYAIITGLHAGHNGLVDNLFYDPATQTTYSTSNRLLVENPLYYGGLPLWQLVQQNGMKAASFFWPGSETKIAGSYPDYWKKYDGRVPNEARIDTVVHWLSLPQKDRPVFVSLYFSLTDEVGHQFGPFSDETRKAVLECDRLLGLIMAQLEAKHLEVNVVLVSDHGMAEIEPKAEKLLAEEKLFAGLDRNKMILTSSGTHVRFYCKDPSYKDELYYALKKRESHFKVYLREETPERWHCRENDRSGDVLLVMDSGYEVVPQKVKDKILKDGIAVGAHGYDPENRDVQGIFYASGPQIVKGKKIPAFENVNVYPFVAELLGIANLPPVDGEKTLLKPYVK